MATFPPTKCGIATFTEDLSNTFRSLFFQNFDFKIIAMKREGEPKTKDKRVFCSIKRDDLKSYKDCAKRINLEKNIALVNVQHEFGIFGGEFGSHLLSFLELLKKPAVVTFHSVVPKPPQEMLTVTKRIAQTVKKIIVMTDDSKKILERDYQITSQKIVVIPHGIHSFPYENSVRGKNKLKLTDKKILLTFGFLSPNKGIEYVLESLPPIVKKVHNILYLVVGETHPVLKKNEGEKYRNFLKQKVSELKLSKHVKFVDGFQSVTNLLLYLKSCDIYISTSLDKNQAVSGTFSYALGTGRPVVSTDFAGARSTLSKENGILVSIKNPAEYSAAILKLLKSPRKRELISQKAYFETRKMTWQNVALAYLRIFSRYLKNLPEAEALPPVSISHILKLTTDFGIIQFAKLSEPDKESGYTVDDNARALISLSLYYSKTGDKSVLRYLKIYLEFLDFTLGKKGYFLNYVDKNRKFITKRNRKESPEDPTSRAIYALARVFAEKKLPLGIRKKAKLIFSKSLEKNPSFEYPRSIAFLIKALCYFLTAEKNNTYQERLESEGDRLISKFNESRSPGWHWPESFLAYSNGTIPEALLLTYKITRKKKYKKTGLLCSNFLIKNSFASDRFSPVGQDGWFHRGGEKKNFDQQPEEVGAMIELTKILYDITDKKIYLRKMKTAFHWFLGENHLGQFIYDCGTGGCYDGLKEKEVNLNQGAESTVSYLISRLIMEEMKKRS